ANRHHEYQPADISEAELMQHALRLSELEAQQRGHVVAGSLLADHPLQEDFRDEDDGSPQEAAEQRARLREEQEAEYQESLRIDRERAEQEALRLKEEEERRRQEAEELESKAKQAEAEEKARQDDIARKLEEAKSMITAEPPPDEPGRLQFQIRTPDGRRLKRAFRPEDTIGQVYAYACVEGGEVLATREFRLVETMPRRTYEDVN
ncbi:PUX10, partial [Symbiodinium pilosum]